MGTVQVLPATRNAARRYKAELTLLICGVTQPAALMSALQTAEQTFADRLEADGIDLAENGTHVVSDPFLAGQDVAIHADLGDAPGAIVDRWVQLIAELAGVDPGVTEVRLPRRRSRIAALFMDTQMYSMTPASPTGRAPTSWLIAAAQWLADLPSARFVAWLNGVEFDVDRGRLAEQLAAGLSMGRGSVAVVAFEGRTMVRFVRCGDGQLDWVLPSPPIVDDAGWSSATEELAGEGLALRPRPAWACLFADLQWSPMLPDLRPGRPDQVPVDECQDDPRWGLPDAYPVVLVPPEWAAACGVATPRHRSTGDLVRVDVIDPRALIPVSQYGEVPRTVDHDTAVLSARERLAPVLATRLREPPPTDEEIARGLGRLAWRYRRGGAPAAQRIAGWLADSDQDSAANSAEHGGTELHTAQLQAADLDAVEASVDSWLADPTKQWVAEEIGVFFGQVLFARIPNSRWITQPATGEPGISLQDGQVIDLFQLARQRVTRGRPALSTVLRDLGGR